MRGGIEDTDFGMDMFNADLCLKNIGQVHSNSEAGMPMY